jgi:hypothetical protein
LRKDDDGDLGGQHLKCSTLLICVLVSVVDTTNFTNRMAQAAF